MNELAPSVGSIFSSVDQAIMLERIADSPLEDAEVGFLSDRNASGERLISESLLAGIRIFSGHAPEQDEPESPAADRAPHESTDMAPSAADSLAAFILFGPAGHGSDSP